MRRIRTQYWQALIAGTLLLAASTALRRKGARAGLGAHQGGGPDPQFVADRDVFHFLLQHHDQIRREVKTSRPAWNPRRSRTTRRSRRRFRTTSPP